MHGANVPHCGDLRLYARGRRRRSLTPMTIGPQHRLKALRAEIADDLARDEAELAAGPEGRAEDTTQSQHPADVASDLFERESRLTMDRRLRSELDTVDDAMRRVREGTYGTCQGCGRSIPPERLEALPQAVRCVECQRREEHQARI